MVYYIRMHTLGHNWSNENVDPHLPTPKNSFPTNNCVRELASFIRRINGSIFNLFYFYRNFVKIYSDKDNGS